MDSINDNSYELQRRDLPFSDGSRDAAFSDERSSRGRGLGVLALALGGGVLAYFLLKKKKRYGGTVPSPTIVGTWYGGDEGWGYLVSNTIQSDDQEFNSQRSFWVLQSPNEDDILYFFSDRLVIWEAKIKKEEKLGLTKIRQNNKKYDEIMKILSECNKQGTINGFAPISEVAEYLKEYELEQGKTYYKEIEVPIPQSTGPVALEGIQSSISQAPFWKIERGHVKTTVHRYRLGGRAPLCKVEISSPSLGTHVMYVEEKKNNIYKAWVNSLKNFEGFGVSDNEIWFDNLNSRRLSLFKVGVNDFWSKIPVFGTGVKNCYYLTAGYPAITQSAVIFAQTLPDASFDTADCLALNQKLCVSPKAVCIVSDISVEKLNKLCAAVRACITEECWPYMSTQRPSPWKPLSGNYSDLWTQMPQSDFQV